MGFMNFENELELKKYVENEIHEFWTWNWYVNRFDQQLLLINVDTFWTNGKKEIFVDFDFGIAKLGI